MSIYNEARYGHARGLPREKRRRHPYKSGHARVGPKYYAGCGVRAGLSMLPVVKSKITIPWAAAIDVGRAIVASTRLCCNRQHCCRRHAVIARMIAEQHLHQHAEAGRELADYESEHRISFSVIVFAFTSSPIYSACRKRRHAG